MNPFENATVCTKYNLTAKIANNNIYYLESSVAALDLYCQDIGFA